MTFPRARLAVSAVLFIGWITFLLVLAVRSPTIIVSRPQLLASSLYVEAEIRDDRGHPNRKVKIVKVLWPADEAAKDLLNKEIDIPELSWYGKPQGYEGARTYLLPLARLAQPDDGDYTVVSIPRAADFFPHPKDRLATVELVGVPRQMNIVAATSVTGSLATPADTTPLGAAVLVAAMIKAGERPVIDCLVEHALKSNNDATALVSLAQKHGVVVARGWPVDQALQLVEKLRRVGAWARVTEFDTQIYPATPQVVAQVDELIALKKK